jgi:hypothetical protein
MAAALILLFIIAMIFSIIVAFRSFNMMYNNLLLTH